MADAVVVLDASAILDASTPGPRFDALTAIHERCAVRAPALLAWELGHVVHGRLARSFGATPAKRALALELMLAGVELVPTDEACRTACGALAKRRSITFYDASYLELAARDDATMLLTQDKALQKATREELGEGRAFSLDDIPGLLSKLGE